METCVLAPRKVLDGGGIIQQSISCSYINCGDCLGLRTQSLQTLGPPVNLNRFQAVSAIQVRQLVKLAGNIAKSIIATGHGGSCDIQDFVTNAVDATDNH